jgi:hypothetical protein
MKRILILAGAVGMLVAATVTASTWVGTSSPEAPKGAASPSAQPVSPAQALAPAPAATTAHTPAEAGSVADPSLELRAQAWHGYYRIGALDQATHTAETEPLVAPLAKTGFKLEVPEGVTLLAFRLEWEGSAGLHEMVHAPMDDRHNMDTYMSAMGDQPSPHCFLVPAENIKPGIWEPMAMNMDNTAADVEFTITVVSAGASAPKILEGVHGHPMQGEWGMTMREAVGCTPEVLGAIAS